MSRALLFPDRYDQRSEWVELPVSGIRCLVLTRLSGRERSKIKSAAMASTARMRQSLSNLSNSDLAMEFEMDMVKQMTAAEAAALGVGVKEWDIDDELTVENIYLLDEEDLAHLLKALNDFWTPRSDDEKKASLESSPTSSSETAPAPTSSPGS